MKRTANSIGYVEFAYAKQNKLDYTLLKNTAGNFVEPNFETFEDAAATGDFDAKKDFYLWLVNAPGKNSWPIAGATFILLAKEKTDSNKKVVKFFDWAFKNGDNKAKELVYVPLAGVAEGQDQGLLEGKRSAVDIIIQPLLRMRGRSTKPASQCFQVRRS